MYFDESGDHGLDKIDPDFPVFVLCGFLYKITEYLQHECPSFSSIKFDTFGHDAVIFHSRDIRKQLGPFQILQDKTKRETFLGRISQCFQQSKATIIAAAVDKRWHKDHYAYPDDPYDIAVLFCLERLHGSLKDRGDQGDPVTCVFEQRGEREDNKLAATFQRICAGANRWGPLPFRMVFANKLANMPGLQLADLAAYPIARRVINAQAANPAYEVLRPLIRKSPTGKVEGWGLKVFP